MKKKVLALLVGLMMVLGLFAGCSGQSPERAAAVEAYTAQVEVLKEQKEAASQALEEASSVLADNKPVSDVTTVSNLETAIENLKSVDIDLPEMPNAANAINEVVEQMKSQDISSSIEAVKTATAKVVASQEDYAMNDTLVTKENGVWGVFSNGTLTDYTGIAKNEYGTWYVKDGKVDFSYTGTLDYAGKTFHINGGKVQS